MNQGECPSSPPQGKNFGRVIRRDLNREWAHHHSQVVPRSKLLIMCGSLKSPPPKQGKNFEKVKKVEKMRKRCDKIHKYCMRSGAGCRKIWSCTSKSLFLKFNCQWDEIRVELGTPKLKEPRFVNSDYPFIKKFKKLWNSRHKCVKLSKMKMSRL